MIHGICSPSLLVCIFGQERWEVYDSRGLHLEVPWTADRYRIQWREPVAACKCGGHHKRWVSGISYQHVWKDVNIMALWSGVFGSVSQSQVIPRVQHAAACFMNGASGPWYIRLLSYGWWIFNVLFYGLASGGGKVISVSPVIHVLSSFWVHLGSMAEPIHFVCCRLLCTALSLWMKSMSHSFGLVISRGTWDCILCCSALQWGILGKDWSNYSGNLVFFLISSEFSPTYVTHQPSVHVMIESNQWIPPKSKNDCRTKVLKKELGYSI